VPPSTEFTTELTTAEALKEVVTLVLGAELGSWAVVLLDGDWVPAGVVLSAEAVVSGLVELSMSGVDAVLALVPELAECVQPRHANSASEAEGR